VVSLVLFVGCVMVGLQTSLIPTSGVVFGSVQERAVLFPKENTTTATASTIVAPKQKQLRQQQQQLLQERGVAAGTTTNSSSPYQCWGRGLRLFTIVKKPGGRGRGRASNNVTQQIFLSNNMGNREHSDMFSEWIVQFLTSMPPMSSSDNISKSSILSSSSSKHQELPPPSPQQQQRRRDILVIVSDDNLYQAGDLSGLPSCVLSVGAGRGFPDAQLVVTPYECSETLRITTTNHIPFSQRPLSKMVWRGDPYADPFHARAALVQLHQQEEEQEQQQPHDEALSWLDAKYAHHALPKDASFPLTPQYMCDTYKYHIDIGGYSGTTWNALRWKMMCGALVFRIESPMGNKDWWHVHLKPFQDYIPIVINTTIPTNVADAENERLPTLTTTNAANTTTLPLSTLTTSLKDELRKWYHWAETHPVEAEQIAKAGQQVSLATGTVQAMQEQMKLAFFNSCTPNWDDYQRYKEYCEGSRNDTTTT
jgi:hypothetical protein